METALRPGELITEVMLPPPEPAQRSLYLRYTPASSEDYPTVGVAVSLAAAQGGGHRVAVAVAGVASTPLLVTEATAAMADGGPVAVAAAAERACDPVNDRLGSAAYKRSMARIWTRRALERALDLE